MSHHTARSVVYHLFLSNKFVEQCLVLMFRAYRLVGGIKTLGSKIFYNKSLNGDELKQAKRYLLARTQELAKLLSN